MLLVVVVVVVDKAGIKRGESNTSLPLFLRSDKANRNPTVRSFVNVRRRILTPCRILVSADVCSCSTYTYYAGSHPCIL